MPAPTFNGVTLYPSGIDREDVKPGRTLESANGTVTEIVRGSPKASWTYTFEHIPAATLATIYGSIYALNTTFTHVDEFGGSYTVLIPRDGYSHEVAFITPTGDVYYNVTLKVRQV